MSNEFDFKEQLEVGTRGEELFLEHYPKKLTIHPGFDGDFIIDKTGEKIELKTDTYNMDKTENFFIERYSDLYKESPGSAWQAYQHGCTKFCYYFVRHNLWYEFNDLPKLIERLEDLTANMGYVRVKNKAWITAGYKIKRVLLEDLYDVYEFE
jgi:hypothetical protein